ncbi:MAG: hypothetical protein AAFW46_08735 [Pseudomonadota bacterium]
MASLFLHPEMILPLWRRALVGARQPARLPFDIAAIDTPTGRRAVTMTEKRIAPLVVLSRFEIEDGRAKPDILLVPPMAGGFPFILRDVVAWLAQRARVHVVEWLNVRAVPDAGRFDVDDQIEATRTALRRIGRPAHLAGFCQAGFAVLAASALMATEDPRLAPLSVALVAAPLEAHRAPSAFTERVLARTPDILQGRRGGRRDPETGEELGVYPAEVQLGVVMQTIAAQNPEDHEFSRLMLRDEGEDPSAVSFLEMATALMDLPWEHFRENLERLYLENAPLAERLRFRGEPARLEALRGVPILTVEGARDALVAPGQCSGALDAIPAGPGVRRQRLVVSAAGHFGQFYGARWRSVAAPALWDLVEHGEARSADGSAKGVRRASA